MPEALESELDLTRASYLLDVRKFEFEQSEAKRTRRLSWISLVATAMVGVAAAVVSCTQLKLAENDDARKADEAKLKTAEDGRRKLEIDLKSQQAYEQRTAMWFKSVTENEAKIFSDDPIQRCRMRALLRVQAGTDFFEQNYAALGVQTSFCDKPQELAIAVQAKTDGAPAGWTRRVAGTGALLVASCSARTENRHGRGDIVASGECALPNDADPSARIYNVEYSCSEYACGWSYNPGGGYGKSTQIAANGRSFQWQRKWDGDPVTEHYTYYYEQQAH